MSEDGYSRQGYFELAAEGSVVALSCSWPFDSHADDWIYIKNLYYASDYSKAISDAAAEAKKTTKIPGVNGGFLEVTQTNSGFLIGFSRAQVGWSNTSLQLHVGRPIGELSPQSLPFREVHGRLPKEGTV
jgi:hypothetical protein